MIKQSMAIYVLVAGLTVLDGRVGCQLGLETKHIDLLVVQYLVSLKKGLYLVDSCSGNISQLLIACINGVLLGNSNQLVVSLSGIVHPHHSQNSHWHKSQRGDLDAGNDHNIEGIVVKSDRPGQESIVDGKDNRSGKDAIEHQESSLLIELVFTVGSFRDFNDGVDSDWRVHVFLNTMQRVFDVLRRYDAHALSVRMHVVVEMGQSRNKEQSQKQRNLQHQQILLNQQARQITQTSLEGKIELRAEQLNKIQSAIILYGIKP